MKNLKFLALITLFITSPAIRAEIALKTFETDGCTLFLDGTFSKPGLWKHCCTEHDLRYWFGGSTKDMDETDLRLSACVEKVAGNYWAQTIYSGVRAGHHSPIKNKYRWNWGWATPREYKELSAAEKNYVVNELKGMSVENVNIDEFIKINFPATN